ncbi:hypothetical protein BRETT_001114 [Brettanomyces bruxellensis]|uniref:Processing of GAS1 and ALP protein 2 n=1 Tax=Dekkera bruxellensis TaxID=5007 RepID=A0A871RED7_DEKBR|nr:uncharacterized protein BRETT_001114 [Brettanomyces bruxellensis]QOU21392.1 hypothetical protein BRETT_001114 [Brettanomyces bruxellensis]
MKSIINWADLDAHKIIQLVIIIGGYIVLRQRFVKYMKNKELKQQLTERKKENAEHLIDRPEDLADDPLSVSERSWGWGKETRKRVRRQQHILEEQLKSEQQTTEDGVDSDAEIENLLQ